MVDNNNNNNKEFLPFVECKTEISKDIIERIEDYPCCMSCYGTVEELRGARNMKEIILKILKGEI